MHVFMAQAATAALRASLVHMHSEVRSVAQEDLGSSLVKQTSCGRIRGVDYLRNEGMEAYGTLGHLLCQR